MNRISASWDWRQLVLGIAFAWSRTAVSFYVLGLTVNFWRLPVRPAEGRDA